MPGRAAVEAHAVQAKNAVNSRNSCGSATSFAASPPLLAGVSEIVLPIPDLTLERIGIRGLRLKVPVEES